MKDLKKAIQSSPSSGLGTFGGVFTPSILTILGVIMYLRFGWVLGNVGLINTLVIVTLATTITFLTGLSIASIATDQQVKTGGAYYMISRSLGIESGGAIGISLYLAQAFSVALYTVGFAESLAEVFPTWDPKWIGIFTSIGVALLALGSAKAAIRAQYIIMIGIVLSLISLAIGNPDDMGTSSTVFIPADQKESFWTVFAVFFPAVTGIMAGVNMSGDLKNPNKSIPKGTFAAIGVGYFIYMALPIILYIRVDEFTLINDPLIMRKIAYWGDAILIGVWGATLSSAVGSILGAPRVLQALAQDGVLPKMFSFLGKGSGESDNPRIGTLFTLSIVLIVVWFGDLNLIAPVLTMFFLTTYGVLNIAAGTERFLGSPSFRPKFKVHWVYSMLGALGCISVMILINFLATIIALVFVGLILIALKRRQLESTWGNVGRGVRMAVIRNNLLRLNEDNDPKNWRPSPIVLAGSPTKRWHLIEFANNFTRKKGLLTVASVITDQGVNREHLFKIKANIQAYLLKEGVEGLVKVLAAKNQFEGVGHLVESYGLGVLQPNTIIVGESSTPGMRGNFCEMIKRFYELQRNVLIMHKGPGEKTFGDYKRIDVWWGGLKGNGGLMMILSYLLTNSLDWRQAKIHIKMVVDNKNAVESAKQNIKNILEEIRIDALVDIIPSENKSFDEILIQSSSDADLIFLGLAVPDKNFESYFEKVQERIKDLPSTVLALAAEELSFGEVLIQKDSTSDTN